MASSDRRFGTDEADWSEKKEIPKAIIASVEREIASSLRVKEAFLRECAAPLAGICKAVAGRLAHGGKVLLFGNVEAPAMLSTSLRNLWGGTSATAELFRLWLSRRMGAR